jgi:hypothetical protein
MNYWKTYQEEQIELRNKKTGKKKIVSPKSPTITPTIEPGIEYITISPVTPSIVLPKKRKRKYNIVASDDKDYHKQWYKATYVPKGNKTHIDTSDRKEYSKQYYQLRKEKIKKYNKDVYHRNKEKLLAYEAMMKEQASVCDKKIED